MATAENSRGNFDQAAAAAQEALKTKPDLWQAHLEIVKALYGREDFAAALRELERLQVDFPDVHLVRANILVRLNRKPEAVQEFAAFLEESPHDSRNARIQEIVREIAESSGK